MISIFFRNMSLVACWLVNWRPSWSKSYKVSLENTKNAGSLLQMILCANLWLLDLWTSNSRYIAITWLPVSQAVCFTHNDRIFGIHIVMSVSHSTCVKWISYIQLLNQPFDGYASLISCKYILLLCYNLFSKD